MRPPPKGGRFHLVQYTQVRGLYHRIDGKHMYKPYMDIWGVATHCIQLLPTSIIYRKNGK